MSTWPTLKCNKKNLGSYIKKCNTVLKRAVAEHFIHAKIESHLTFFMTLGSEHWRGECFETRFRNYITCLLDQLWSAIKKLGGLYKKVQYSFEKGSGGAFHPYQNRIPSTFFKTLGSEHWWGECFETRFRNCKTCLLDQLWSAIKKIWGLYKKVQYSFEKGGGGAFHPCQNRIPSNFIYDTRVRTLAGGVFWN